MEIASIIIISTEDICYFKKGQKINSIPRPRI